MANEQGFRGLAECVCRMENLVETVSRDQKQPVIEETQ